MAISVTNKSLQRLALQLQFRKEVMHGIVCSSASHQVCLCFTTFSWGHRFHLTHYFHLRKTEHWRYGSQDDANSLGRIPRYCWRSSCHSCSSLSRHPITARVYPNGHSSPCTSRTGFNFLVIQSNDDKSSSKGLNQCCTEANFVSKVTISLRYSSSILQQTSVFDIVSHSCFCVVQESASASATVKLIPVIVTFNDNRSVRHIDHSI